MHSVLQLPWRRHRSQHCASVKVGTWHVRSVSALFPTHNVWSTSLLNDSVQMHRRNLKERANDRKRQTAASYVLSTLKWALTFTCSLNKLHCHLLAISSKWEPRAQDDKCTQQPTKSWRKTAGERGCVTLTLRQLLLSKAPNAHFISHTQRPFFVLFSF